MEANMASRCWSQQSDNESEVSDLEYDVPVGGGEKGAATFQCDGRKTDGAVNLDGKGVRRDLCNKHNDVAPKKRGLFHDSFRRDDAKRSRPPSTPDGRTRQCRGQAERPDVVDLQAVHKLSNPYVDGVKVPQRQAPREASRFLSSISHLDTSGFGQLTEQHRVSWRDSSTDSMTSCMLRSGERPELDMRCAEMVTSRDANLAQADVHSEFETGNGLIHVSSEKGAVECIVNIYTEGESDLPHQIDVPLNDCNTKTNSFQRIPTYPRLERLVCPLEKGDKEYQDVEKKFLGGLHFFSSGTVVTGISRDASPRGQERLQAFEKLQDLTRKARGDENVCFAWHGTSKTGVSGIFAHGFGQPRTPKNGSAYGVGVYLAPESQSHVSAIYADNDEKGEQHVVLCRVILGASELVAYGSDQFHPSSEHFDTGVDDLVNPKRLIVWSTHMNTHILPLYVVSFRLPPTWHHMVSAQRGKRVHPGASMKQFCTARQKCQKGNNEMNSGSFCKQGPTSPFISFPQLFLLLSPLLAPERLQHLRNYHREFQAKRLTRSQLIQHLRIEVGDDRLVHAIKLLQGSQEKELSLQISKGQEQINYESPISFTGRAKISCETPLSFTTVEKFKCGTPLSFTSIEKSKCETPLSFTAVNLSSTDSLVNVQGRTVHETR